MAFPAFDRARASFVRQDRGGGHCSCNTSGLAPGEGKCSFVAFQRSLCGDDGCISVSVDSFILVIVCERIRLQRRNLFIETTSCVVTQPFKSLYPQCPARGRRVFLRGTLCCLPSAPGQNLERNATPLPPPASSLAPAPASTRA